MASDNEAIYDLHEQLTQKAGEMREALSRVDAMNADDPTGQVSVRLEGFAVDVSVGTFWRTSIRPDALSGVILETMNALLISRLEAWGSSFTDNVPSVVPKPVASAAIQANEIAELVASADGDVFHRNVNRFIDTFSSRLGATLRELTDRANQLHQGADSYARARVDMDSRGTIVNIQFDEDWLRGAEGGEVTSAISAAISNAQQTLAAATPSLPFKGTPLDDYAEGIADPVELIRTLTRGG